MGRSSSGSRIRRVVETGLGASKPVKSLVLAAGLASAFCGGTPPSESEGTAKLPRDVTTAPLAQNLAPFNIVGFVESFTLDDPTNLLSSAKMVVNGITVVIPGNTIVTLPAAFMTPAELFLHAPPSWGPTQSGLALSDTPKPLTTYEVTVDGNRVGDQFIAGLVSLAQQSLNTSSGMVNYIDYQHGELRVGGPIGVPDGTRVTINDPNGRFGRPGSPDGRFQVDDENPTVHASTGYPMCIPRVSPDAGDPLCPETNRPLDPMTGGFLSNFVMAHPGGGVVTDPNQQAPFEIGDYITFSGNLQNDVRGNYIAAWNVNANLGIFTTPGTTPVYLTTEVVQFGTGGLPLPGLPQEATIRAKVEGFTTDPTSLVDIFGIDVAPCSGEERERLIGFADPLAGGGGLIGRFRFIVDALNFQPLFREIRLRSHAGQTENVANGLTAGQYRSPVGEFIFAENFVLGSPAVPLNFQDFPFLAQGSGPLGGEGPIVAQLAPWPGVPTPPPAVCEGTNSRPVADAGPDLNVLTRALVRLAGNKSFDPDFTPITFHWTQVGGPAVALSDTHAATPTFTAPRIRRGQAAVTLTFQLQVTDPHGASATDTVTVTVQPAGDDVTITVATFRLRRSILTVTATSTNPTAIMNLSGFGVMTNNGDGTYSFAAIGQEDPGTVTVNSSLGGSDTINVVRIP
jgi:hypothetical protein